MATYYWIGGTTANPDDGTGLTPGFVTFSAGAGPSGVDLWINTLDGTTSVNGDIWFRPYFWGESRNWKKQINATGGGILLKPVLSVNGDIPKGGDTVKFSDNIQISNGNTFRTYSTSLLYGGMSGDGATSSGQTAWNSKGASANTHLFGDINFIVERTFVSGANGTNALGLDSGRIGASPTGSGDWSFYDYSIGIPLRIRTKSFDVSASVTGSGAVIAIDNISTQSGNAIYGQRMIVDSTNTDAINKQVGRTTSYLIGDFKYITIDQGNCYINDLYPRNSGVTSDEGAIVNLGENSKVIGTFSSSRMSNIDKIYIAAAKWDNISIWGNGTTAAMSLVEVKPFSYASYSTLYQSLNPICIGDFGSGGTGPVIRSLRLNTVGDVGGSGSVGGSIKLASSTINYLEGWDGGKIRVHENVSESDNITIRNGFIKSQFELNMAHPEQSEWSNFSIGATSSDTGIRIDSNSAIVKFFPTQTLKTSSTIPGISGPCV